ncbi:MAG: sorbitol dehydrogenase family protein [Proteobacteria bacterium]|nr:sorbitol dehydrogenase family protein [Pseudomonadota bacterium]
MDRRQLLLALAAIPLASNASFAQNSGAAAAPDVAALARLLIGRPDYSDVIIGRAQAFQADLDATFAARLAGLVQAVARIGSKDREAVIAGLSQAEVATAVQLISPLYLGYTGSPSTTSNIDNSRFVTFLKALMYEPTADNVPRPSYAHGGPNYWTATPDGVKAPPMPADILEWGDKSPKAASTYATPDPRYVVICQGHAKTLAEAEAWLAKK